jgi:hypothetical protein
MTARMTAYAGLVLAALLAGCGGMEGVAEAPAQPAAEPGTEAPVEGPEAVTEPPAEAEPEPEPEPEPEAEIERGFALGWPVSCRAGRDCFIDGYVDHDPGEGFADYRCGALGADAQAETGIRLRNLEAMRAGVSVLAAAPGRVVSVRDDMEDNPGGFRTLPGREGGNEVVIDHGEGWRTVYTHLEQGAPVRRGQQVAAGTRIGGIGMSGWAEVPRLGFAVLKDGAPMDPFDGLPATAACAERGAHLWHGGAPPYLPAAVLNIGFSADIPDSRSVRDGAAPTEALRRDAPAMLLYVDAMGLRAGDIQVFSITGPEGIDVYYREVPVERDDPVWFGYAGQARMGAGFFPGIYKGRWQLKRDGAVVAEAAAEVALR